MLQHKALNFNGGNNYMAPMILSIQEYLPKYTTR